MGFRDAVEEAKKKDTTGFDFPTGVTVEAERKIKPKECYESNYNKCIKTHLMNLLKKGGRVKYINCMRPQVKKLRKSKRKASKANETKSRSTSKKNICFEDCDDATEWKEMKKCVLRNARAYHSEKKKYEKNTKDVQNYLTNIANSVKN